MLRFLIGIICILLHRPKKITLGLLHNNVGKIILVLQDLPKLGLLHKNVGKKILVLQDLPKLGLLRKNVGKIFLVLYDLPKLGVLHKNVGKTTLIYSIVTIQGLIVSKWVLVFSLAKNIPNATEFICTICLLNTKSSGFQ